MSQIYQGYFCWGLAVIILLLPAAVFAQTETYTADWESLDRRPLPLWWTEAKFGIFIHWGIYAVPSFSSKDTYSEWYWHALTRDPAELSGKQLARHKETADFHARVYGKGFTYPEFAPLFRAELFNPEEWADLFARSGAKYVVLTSKHHDGFCLWPSREADRTWGRPWNCSTVGPQRDLLGELTRAVRNTGLKMGIYYSLYEWFNPLWLKDRERYVAEHMIPQFKDVVSRYAPAVIFSDGEWDMPAERWKSKELIAWLYNHAPSRQEIVLDDRWGSDTRHKHGDYYTTEYGGGMAGAEHPWEESRGMGSSYGYNRNEGIDDYKGTRALILILVDMVSRGGNLLLDIGPTADGRIPVIMQDRLIGMGDWLQVNGEAIYGTKPWTRATQWTTGQRPDREFKPYMAQYDIMERIGNKPLNGIARIQLFFTLKGDCLYVIMPVWPGDSLIIPDLQVTAEAQVSLLGSQAPLAWQEHKSGISIDLSRAGAAELAGRSIWVLRIAGIKHAD